MRPKRQNNRHFWSLRSSPIHCSRTCWCFFLTGKVRMLRERHDVAKALTPEQERTLLRATAEADLACHTAKLSHKGQNRRFLGQACAKTCTNFHKPLTALPLSSGRARFPSGARGTPRRTRLPFQSGSAPPVGDPPLRTPLRNRPPAAASAQSILLS